MRSAGTRLDHWALSQDHTGQLEQSFRRHRRSRCCGFESQDHTEHDTKQSPSLAHHHLPQKMLLPLLLSMMMTMTTTMMMMTAALIWFKIWRSQNSRFFQGKFRKKCRFFREKKIDFPGRKFLVPFIVINSRIWISGYNFGNYSAQDLSEDCGGPCHGIFRRPLEMQ